MALLWLLYGYAVAVAMTAASHRREAVLCLPCQPGENKYVSSFFGSSSPTSLSAHALPTLGSTNSESVVNSETIGLVSRISNTTTEKNIVL